MCKNSRKGFKEPLRLFFVLKRGYTALRAALSALSAYAPVHLADCAVAAYAAFAPFPPRFPPPKSALPRIL